MPNLEGIFPIVAIPFNEDGSLDLRSLRQQVEYLLEAGASGIGTGLASEIFFLTDEERITVTTTIAGVTSGSAVNVASTGGDSEEILRDRALAAAGAGADALMLLPPTFFSFPSERLTGFAEVAAEAGLPLILQDAPGLTGAAMPAEWLIEQLSNPSVAGVKIEASPSLSKIEKVRAGSPSSAIFGGGGGVMYPEEFGRGATGCMPGPIGCTTFAEAHAELQNEEIPISFWKLVPLLRYMMLGIDLFIWAQKTLLARAGVIAGNKTRIPLVNVDAGTERELLSLADSAPIT